jgi:probable HAF family extracellular repeat protein
MPATPIRALAGALALATLAATARAAEWQALDLGALGGRNSYASAVSDGGVVAGCAETASGEIHAFVYENGTMRGLGRGSDAPGNSCGLAVDGRGAVAGRASTGELVIWASGGITRLGIHGNVGGMNAAGVVVGARAIGDATRAFIYKDGVVADIGGVEAPSEASAINAREQVAGTANGRAFVHEGGAMRDLGTLGGNHSAARGINAQGVVVGQSSNELGQPTPFIHQGTMRALPGPAYSSAIGINGRGQVIGSGEGIHGYLLEGGAMTLLGEIPAVVAKGWRRLQPTAINERGWIVGTAENAEGDLRAFLLMPAGTASKPRRIPE